MPVEDVEGVDYHDCMGGCLLYCLLGVGMVESDWMLRFGSCSALSSEINLCPGCTPRCHIKNASEQLASLHILSLWIPR